MDGVDFYVYGHLPIHIGGVTVYITTSHICLAIVMAALIIFAIAANRKIKKADPTKAPTGFLNVIELLVETLDNLVKSNMGKTLAPKFKNYIGVIFMFLVKFVRAFWTQTTDCGLWYDTSTGVNHFCYDSVSGNQMAEVGKTQRFV